MCKRDATPQNITVILPAYNEEISIGSIVLLTKNYADNVIVIDDGSSDRTAELARKAGAEVIVHEINKGKGGALKTGFAAAEGADIIVTMNSDGQHNPADIPRLVEPILKGEADMVNGSRYLYRFGKNTPVYRRVGQITSDKTINLNSGLKITDSQSGFRAFAASAKDIFRFTALGMAIDSEILVDADRSGLKITEVKIGNHYDIDYSKSNPLNYFVENFIRFMKHIKVNRPLYYYSIPGFVLTTISLYSGVKLLESLYLDLEKISLIAILLIILLTILGIFMTAIGIIMHSMVGNITQTKFSQ